MPNTRSRFKETKARFGAGLSLSLARNASSTFQVQLQISEPKLELFSAARWVSLGNGPADEQGRFQNRVCSAAPLLPKTRGAAPTMPADFSPSAPSVRSGKCPAPAVTVAVATLDENGRAVGSADYRMRRSNRHG